MEEVGVDMSPQHSKSLMEYIAKVHFSYLITVCSNAEKRCPVFPGMGVRLHWPFGDPASVIGNEEEKLAIFRRVRNEIEVAILTWVAGNEARG